MEGVLPSSSRVCGSLLCCLLIVLSGFGGALAAPEAGSSGDAPAPAASGIGEPAASDGAAPAALESGEAIPQTAAGAGDPAPSSGATPAPSEPHPYGWHQIGRDARYLARYPFHLDQRGWLKVAATFGTAAILYIDRVAIRNAVQERRTTGGENFLEQPRTMGKGAFAPSLALISYGASFATHDDREKETAVLLLESMAFTGVLVGIGQFVLSTERPDQGKEINYFHWGGHGVSGDAALASSVVPVLRNQYLRVHPGDGGGLRAWKYSATGLLYAGAFLTAYQRVYSDKHWAPDAFLGSVTGFTVGQMLCDSHQQVRNEAKVHAEVGAIPGGIGLKLTFR